ncbi:tRNA lysidine(34) synthetase TilS [Synechococcus sp. CBW1002]|uniref:tRNA lysidine(34) synthetase TilS n=1 Tax=Synechococcus sp. CBW1002 TaxID=1353134 RepID=UPI001E65DDAA|nr:tRNA lysidine(34) synthetase TilS [Synechococcus sp. CBW1002]
MILPSETVNSHEAPAGAPAKAQPHWSADHLSLHQLLRQQPQLLPAGAPLLLAVSGGQDSMAMTGLLLDLTRLHGWSLQLWHGDHGWRPESGQQAAELAQWAQQHGLALQIDRAEALAPNEAAARHWRYERLAHWAERLGCQRVVTAHTASDRAETLLLHLARGSHRRGLASLRRQRPLLEPAPSDPAAETAIQLVRPLLLFSRSDTARLCRELGLPVWTDPSNTDPRFARNRLRQEVLPVLEQLHPGATRRIGAQAERLAEELERDEELVALALAGLHTTPATSTHEVFTHEASSLGRQLQRAPLVALSLASQRALLQHWLSQHNLQPLSSRQLETLLARLAPRRGPGRLDLAGGWRLRWDRSTLALLGPTAGSPLHD